MSPEHLSKAYDEEVQQWMAISHEQELIDAMPAAGGTDFLDLRKAPKPPEDLPAADEGEAEGQQREEPQPELPPGAAAPLGG